MTVEQQSDLSIAPRQERTVEVIASDLAREIFTNYKHSEEWITRLLIEFAEEVKRQAIEQTPKEQGQQ